MQADPATERTMTFIVVGEDVPYEKIAASAEEGATESTVCGKLVCVYRPDSYGGCDLFKWLCVKLGGQHTEAATSEGCFF